MAILKIKHNSQLFADLSAATSGVVAAMENAQVGEFWAGDYGTGAVLAFKGVNGVSVFSDAAALTAEFKASLQNYYTKEEIDTLFNTKLSKYYTKDELDVALDSIVNSAISVVGGDGIIITGDGTEKTISTNVELEIKTVEGKEMIQLLDATDNSKVLAEVDASKFVVDGMLDSASIVTINDETELPEGVELPNGKYIKLTWNTDAGKSDTYVAVADLISEHQVNAGEDVAGEFVVVTTNVVESTDENGVKVSTVNVTVNDTAVKTALDEKIGVDDGMLILTTGGGSKVETVSFEQYGRYEIQDLHGNWTILVNDGGAASYGGNSVTLSDPNRDGAQIAASTNYGTDVKFVCENGTIRAYGYDDNMGDYEEQGTLTEGSGLYYIEFNSQKGFSGTIEIQSVAVETSLNTKESLEYLADVKADKTELDSKIGKEDVLYSINNNIEETVNVSANSSTVAVSNAIWSMHLTSATNGVYELYKTDSDGPVYSVDGSFYLTNEVDFSHNNGELTVTYMDNFGSYEMKTDVITIDPNASYYLKTTVNAAVLLKYTGNASYNTQESIEYMFNTIEPLIDTKIGKDDVIMGVEGGTRVETLNADNNYRTTLIEGDEWNVSIDAPMGYTGTDCNVYDELGNKVITAEYNYGGRFQIELKNGILSAKSYHDGAGSFMGPQVEVSSGKKYSVGFDSLYSRDSVDVTIVTTDSRRNLVESIEYINNNINNVVVDVAQKLGRDEIVLSWGDKQTQQPITLQPGGRARYNGGISNWEIEIYDETYGTYNLINQNTGETVYNWVAEGPYSKTIKFIHNNGELEIIYWSNNESETSETINIDPSAYYEVESVESNLGVATVTVSNGAGESFNTSDALHYLNNEMVSIVTELELKADKTEVESSLALKADKTEVDTKIGVDDEMLNTYTSNSIVLAASAESELFGGDYWKIDAYDRARILASVKMQLISENDTQIFEINVTSSPKVIELKDNVIHVYNDNNGSLTEESSYDSISNNYKIKAIDGPVYATLTTSEPINTKDSLEYLNENKADKVEVETSISDVNIALDNKLGKFDTVLSVNEGEIITDYNVEGALGYLKSEIETMNVIDCGTY